jgi:peptidoglycan LD-endopeptidase LytH
VRRRLAAIVGVAFCLGALTALWAARPLYRPAQSEELFAGKDDPMGPPAGAVGTYGETDSPHPADSGAGDAVAPLTAPVPALPASGDRDAAPVPVDLRERSLVIPVQGVKAAALQSTFHAQRATGEHEAIDVLAPKGTPVLAVEAGEIVKLFYSVRGGKTIYQFDRSGRYCYYYAHLDRYASGLAEKQTVSQGQVIGYVGTTGNADANAPHLHFAIFRLGPNKHWWQGTPMDPYPVLSRQ